MTNRPTVGSRLALLLTALFLAPAFSCSEDDGSDGNADGGNDDGGTDTGVEDTDSWLDEYNMPFDPEPFQWANVPGGLDQPTVETFAGRVLLIMFFQKW